VDYDLIEVNNGACWSLKRRGFVEDAIAEHQIGKVTPRAFCPYEPNQVPDAKYFRQILENSLTPDEVCSFCEEYVKLLNYNKKKHKDKVLCLVGDANSGKTSLFFPILGLLHHGNVATVTKKRAFNKSMITPFAEVIFLDEATESTLDIDD
jgi:polynucleotide 5'-kinase involved in rRNA processing